ncbi:MAG: PHP domain-containing protein [Gemmatimonadaceae bacterium]|nr:PHP domain-containing protein [Gemmatimonadaceae bacterium]
MTAPRAALPPGEVDLHMHSTASDGSLPPSQVIAAASAARLAAVALTDHDTMAGVAEAAETGRRLGVRVIRGVELSAHHGAREIHVLALHISRPAIIESRLIEFREARERRAVLIVGRLRALGAAVDVDAVMQEAAGGAVGRPHIARALIRGGFVRDSREAFERYLGAGRAAFVPKQRLEVRDAIALTHSAGGLAVWAHPGAECRRARLEPLVGMGLDGVEVRHPGHLAEDVSRIAALADFLGLLPSGGSDWHGSLEGPRSIGSMHIPAHWLERQDEAAAKRIAAEVA